LSVPFTISGTAVSGTDYAPITSPVTIPAGQASVVISVLQQNPATNKTVILTLNANAAYAVAAPGSATVNITYQTVTIVATDPNAVEIGPDTGTFTVSRTGSGGMAATVFFTISGTATNGVDYNSIANQLMLNPGQLSGTVTVTPISDGTTEGNETVILTVNPDPRYLVGTPGTATVTITDLPTVTIVATDASAGETGPDTGTFTVTRSFSTPAPFSVLYTISGTASNGVDYTTISSPLVLPLNQPSATITITPLSDALTEGPETVILTLTANAAYIVGTPNSATVTIADASSLPTVTIAATDATAQEPGNDTGTFTVTRTGATTAALSVAFTVSGTATSGSDYTALTAPLTIPAGSASATLTVTPLADAVIEGDETVIVTLGANAAYIVGSPSAATVTLKDQSVSIAATDANAAEPGNDTGTFTVTRTGSTVAALSVAFTVSGTATSGTDYTALTSPLTIAAGSATGTITVTPLADNVTDANETVIVTLSANAAYALGTSAATVTITDQTLSIAATDAVAGETGPDTGTFTITRTGSTVAALSVPFTISGTATNGTDYTTITSPATIAAGSATGTITVTPADRCTDRGQRDGDPDPERQCRLCPGHQFGHGEHRRCGVATDGVDRRHRRLGERGGPRHRHLHHQPHRRDDGGAERAVHGLGHRDQRHRLHVAHQPGEHPGGLGLGDADGDAVQ